MKKLALLIHFLFVFILGACATNGVKDMDGPYETFNGEFKCPKYQDGEIQTGGVDIEEYVFSQAIREINGVPVMVTKRLSGDSKNDKKPSVNIIDGQWHLKDFTTPNGKMMAKKVFVEFQGTNKIHWISEMPSYKTKEGVLRKALRAEGYEWVDDQGHMNYSASNYKGTIQCMRNL